MSVETNSLPTRLEPYLSEYAGKYQIMLEHFENSPDPLPVKLKEFEKELNKLKAEFKKIRKNEYADGPFKVEERFHCTKGYSGGSKKCGPHCISSPNPNALYVFNSGYVLWNDDPKKKKKWGKQSGKRSYCYTKKKSGKGKDRYTVGAVFEIPKSWINKKADKDVTILFNYIIDSSV